MHLPGRDEVMNMENPLEALGRAAVAASREMAALSPQEKTAALLLMAAGVRGAAERIIRENSLDMEEAGKNGRNAAFLDRLLLTPERVEHMARGMEQVAALPDPVGECIRECRYSARRQRVSADQQGSCGSAAESPCGVCRSGGRPPTS